MIYNGFKEEYIIIATSGQEIFKSDDYHETVDKFNYLYRKMGWPLDKVIYAHYGTKKRETIDVYNTDGIIYPE